MHRSTCRPNQSSTRALRALALLLTLAVLSSACGADDGGGEHSDDDSGGDPSMDYCNCMLNRCHDVYHSTWGEDHLQSESACLGVAEALPQAGEEATEGNFLECRQHYCSAAEVIDGSGDDADNCPQAMGEHTCL